MEAPVKVEVRGRCMSARSAPGTPFHAPRLLRVYARAAPRTTCTSVCGLEQATVAILPLFKFLRRRV